MFHIREAMKETASFGKEDSWEIGGEGKKQDRQGNVKCSEEKLV
jgi:hypothetical protein